MAAADGPRTGTEHRAGGSAPPRCPAPERAGQSEYPVGLIADLLTRLPAAVAYLSGPQHVFRLANDVYRRLVGGREIIGLPVREALPELAGQDYFEILDRVFATGEPSCGEGAEFWIRQAGDEPQQMFVDFSVQPVRGSDGTIAGVLVHAADVTPHIRVRQRLEALTAQLAEAEERYRTLFQTMPQGIVYHDANGAIISLNAAAAATLGGDAEELMGRRSEDPRWQAVREDGSPFPGAEHPAMVALRTGRSSPTPSWASCTAAPESDDG